MVPTGLHHRLQGDHLGQVPRQLHLAAHEGIGRLQLSVENLEEDLLGEGGGDVCLASRFANPHAHLVPNLQVDMELALALDVEDKYGIDLLGNLRTGDPSNSIKNCVDLSVLRWSRGEGSY